MVNINFLALESRERKETRTIDHDRILIRDNKKGINMVGASQNTVVNWISQVSPLIKQFVSLK